jgi:hypothetical protein
MKQSIRGEWKTGWHWLLWWKIDPDELRRQTETYNSLGTYSIRGIASIFAVVSGFVNAFWGVRLAISTLDDGWPTIGVNESGIVTDCVLLAEGVTFLLLARLLYRGEAWTAIVLMGLCSFDRLFEAALSHGHVYSLRGGHPGVVAVVALLAWCCCMHAFWTAFCVERQRIRPGGTDAVALSGS